jgi:hypothetical protein
MTVEQLTLVCVGVLVNGLTFALGILSGASLKRKDSSHDRDRNKARQVSQDPNWWHKPQRRDARPSDS